MKVLLDDKAFEPTRAHKTDAGLDLRSPVDVYIPPCGFAVIDTGVHVQLPHGTVGMIKSKSGLNVKHGITGEGVIDEGDTGSIVVKLDNSWHIGYHVHRGDKISQLVILPCVYESVEITDKLDDSERGGGGFGSTGR